LLHTDHDCDVNACDTSSDAAFINVVGDSCDDDDASLNAQANRKPDIGHHNTSDTSRHNGKHCRVHNCSDSERRHNGRQYDRVDGDDEQ
jgi:hypothetical protein